MLIAETTTTKGAIRGIMRLVVSARLWGGSTLVFVLCVSRLSDKVLRE